jgi:hypothetical protein
MRREQSPAAIPLVPAVMLLKDTAKLVGTTRTLALGQKGESRSRT